MIYMYESKKNETFEMDKWTVCILNNKNYKGQNIYCMPAACSEKQPQNPASYYYNFLILHYTALTEPKAHVNLDVML